MPQNIMELIHEVVMEDLEAVKEIVKEDMAPMLDRKDTLMRIMGDKKHYSSITPEQMLRLSGRYGRDAIEHYIERMAKRYDESGG